MKNEKKKTGLFFGSFNPIHIGHLALANYMVEYHELQECWFVISPHNPLKEKKNLLHHAHRYRMVLEAIEDYPKFRASDIEFHLPQPSYTIHTLTYLEEKYPDRDFYLIMGADNLSTLHKWKNHDVILQKYHLLVYPRPGYENHPYDLHSHIIMTNAPLMDISSTFIRNAVREGKDIRFFLHPAVWKYMDEMNFYK
ncbi:MAG: nicotinate (nicotinamide) nucleotide adenylyltransferase [Bacteroidia bacterium]|nr:nicotinate (nicotinamide) nucleotide adenylyltransferase [Bacteroidia bacterium]